MQNDLVDTEPMPDSLNAELRRAVPTDAAAVREVTRAAYAKWVPIIGREPMPMKADYHAALRQHLIDLLIMDGQVAALIETIPQSDHLLIENVAVLPTFQRRGLGRRLMAHAEALALSLGLAEIRLYTNKDVAANVRLYLDLGYRVDREEPFMGGTTVYMSKSVFQPSQTDRVGAAITSKECGTTDLAKLLATMEPELSYAEVVFRSIPDSALGKLPRSSIGLFREREGVTLIVERSDAEKQGIPFHTVFSSITLNVHSSLEAVGFTAAIAARLSLHGISANFVGAYYHDHLFVPASKVQRALGVLRALQAEAVQALLSIGRDKDETDNG